MWHFGRDASIEYSGEKFEMTFSLATGILIRVYSKQMKGKKTNIRLERQEYPNIPLVDAIEARILYWKYFVMKQCEGCIENKKQILPKHLH